VGLENLLPEPSGQPGATRQFIQIFFLAKNNPRTTIGIIQIAKAKETMRAPMHNKEEPMRRPLVQFFINIPLLFI
jgi:hypothetical protein